MIWADIYSHISLDKLGSKEKHKKKVLISLQQCQQSLANILNCRVWLGKDTHGTPFEVVI